MDDRVVTNLVLALMALLLSVSLFVANQRLLAIARGLDRVVEAVRALEHPREVR